MKPKMLCSCCVSGYVALGVDEEKTPYELRSVFRELVKQWHPDRYEHDTSMRVVASQKLSAINAAYTHIASCENTRKRARASSHQSSGLNHFCNALDESGFQYVGICYYGSVQQSSSTCRRPWPNFGVSTRTSKLAQMLAVTLAVCFALVALCLMFPDMVNDISLYTISLET